MTQTTAVMVESILESHLHLIPLMVGVDGESADIGGMTEAAQKIAAEIDALTRERDEARAEVVSVRAQCDQLSDTLVRERDAYSERAAKQATDGALRLMAEELEQTIRERNDARAEVERLRPAAEAWEARESWRNSNRRTFAEVEEAQTRMNETAARAREAAKGQA